MRGKVISIEKQYTPFIRNFSPRLVTVEIENGKRVTLMPRMDYRHKFWTGEKIKFNQSSGGALVFSNLQYDSLMWHWSLVNKWPTSKKSWQEVIKSLGQESRFEEMLIWVPGYAKNFGGDDFLTYTGNEYWMKQDIQNAVAFFHAAHSKAPNDYNILKYYGFYLAKQGKRPEGIKLLEQATAIQPENFEAFYQLGHTLIESGKSKEAIPVLKRTLELNPNLADIKAALDRIERTPAVQK